MAVVSPSADIGPRKGMWDQTRFAGHPTSDGNHRRASSLRAVLHNDLKTVYKQPCARNKPPTPRDM